MAFTASPQQMRILKQTVDDYCRDRGILDSQERLHAAEMVSALLELGAISLNDLRRGLEDAMGLLRTT